MKDISANDLIQDLKALGKNAYFVEHRSDFVENARPHFSGNDVLLLMERLSLERPAVLGHSMGGKTAMALALRHPQRVGRLIVVDIAPVAYADTLTPFAEAMRGADVVAAATRAEVRARLRQANRLFESTSGALDADTLSRIEESDIRASRVFAAEHNHPTGPGSKP